jgi:hypothetical protein
LLEQLETVRKECPAINLVFLPDDVWPCYRHYHRQTDLDFLSILLPALQNALLGRVTSAIHRFLITDGSLRSEVTTQYKKDLRERWWRASSPLERNRQYRTFKGRLAELQFAERLERRGWSINSLEAWGANVDIDASAPDGISTSFEVKYIGTEDDDFKTLLRAMESEDGTASGKVSPYAAINYLLFRTYEAAQQLKSSDGCRIVVIIISDFDWWRFEHQLVEQWIEWNEPCFYKADKIWDDFCIKQRNKYPDLTDDLPKMINTLHEVWILEWTSDFEFVLKYKKQIKTSESFSDT